MANSTSQINAWSSRWSLILGICGASIGLGNIWKFPYEMGVHGGATFLYVYLVCVLLIAFPLMLAEIMIGRYGRQNPIDGIINICKAEHITSAWQAIGWLSIVSGIVIFAFYSTVASWILFYIMKSVSGAFIDVPAEIVQNEFGALLENTDQMLIWHSVFTLAVVFVLTQGFNQGVERFLRLLMPCFTALLIWLLLYARNFGDFSNAISFMFDIDFSLITVDLVFHAMTQAFFTLSIGMGVLIVYGSYIRDTRSVFSIIGLVMVADTLVAILMAMVIFSVVFAFDMNPQSGAGLIFETLPVAFSQMPNSIIWGSLFFLFLFHAALFSSLSLMEPGLSWLITRFSIQRKTAAWLMGTLVWFLGLLSVYAFSDLSFSFFYFGRERQYGYFDMLIILATDVLLPVTAALISVFAGWFITRKQSKELLSIRFDLGYKIWRISIKAIAPVIVLLLLWVMLSPATV